MITLENNSSENIDSTDDTNVSADIEAISLNDSNNDEAEELEIVSEGTSSDSNKIKTFELVSSIEAVIFAAGDPIPSQNLLEFFQIDVEELNSIIKLIQEQYESNKHGIELRKINDSYAFASKSVNKEILSSFFSKPIKTSNLSQAAYETLAVVAYNQPVTRADLEQVRGVNSDGALNRLIEKGLVEQSGNLETPGRPSLFSVTNLFFNLYGIEDLSQLEPMDMLMYDTIMDFERSYQMETEVEDNSIDGEELGTVY